MTRLDFAALRTGLLIAVGLVALVACDRDGSAPSPTATAGMGPSPTVPETALATDTPAPDATATPGFEGRRDPIEVNVGNVPAAKLVDVRAASHDQFDRVVFEFADSRPGYRVEYVAPPVIACGSGSTVDIAGAAFLQVRMSTAVAHDDAGEPTFDVPEPSPDLPSVVVLEQTCDFEGEVTWVAGLSAEVDFRVLTLEEPYRIVIDVAHP